MIEKRKLHKNQTLRFLLPTLIEDREIAKKYRQIYKTGVYVCLNIPNTLIISIDTNHFSDKIEDFKEILKEKNLFVKEGKGNKYEGELLIWVKIPEEYKHAYKMFLEGHYSSMYNKEEINRLFPSKEKVEIFLILTKNNLALKTFEGMIGQEFGTDLTAEELKNFKEYALPPKIEDEVYFKPKTEYKYIKTYINEMETT